VILGQRSLGSNWDLVNHQVPFAFVINYEMQGLELVTLGQEVFAGAGDI